MIQYHRLTRANTLSGGKRDGRCCFRPETAAAPQPERPFGSGGNAVPRKEGSRIPPPASGGTEGREQGMRVPRIQRVSPRKERQNQAAAWRGRKEAGGMKSWQENSIPWTATTRLPMSATRSPRWRASTPSHRPPPWQTWWTSGPLPAARTSSALRSRSWRCSLRPALPAPSTAPWPPAP